MNSANADSPRTETLQQVYNVIVERVRQSEKQHVYSKSIEETNNMEIPQEPKLCDHEPEGILRSGSVDDCVRSCFGGFWSAARFRDRIVIDPSSDGAPLEGSLTLWTVCFESDDPFGPAYTSQVNDRWNPDIDYSDCAAYEVAADEGCQWPGLLHPTALFPTPEGIEQFDALPPPAAATATATESRTATEITQTAEVAVSRPPPRCSPTKVFIPYRPLRYGRFMFLMYTLAW
jgi:hypothetical protein